ncbi:MAG: hypothetical protein O2966_00920 [Proteobacteria bacterium]|nr:hypothetical protein [Pseudomonadota bacterium]
MSPRIIRPDHTGWCDVPAQTTYPTDAKALCLWKPSNAAVPPFLSVISIEMVPKRTPEYVILSQAFLT